MAVSETTLELVMRAAYSATPRNKPYEQLTDAQFKKLKAEVRAALTAALSDQVVARPLSEYHEDMGPMLWWHWEPPQPFKQISERVVSSAHDGCWLGAPPYVGAPHYDDWPNYHTHFTSIQIPAVPASTPVRSS